MYCGGQKPYFKEKQPNVFYSNSDLTGDTICVGFFRVTTAIKAYAISSNDHESSNVREKNV